MRNCGQFPQPHSSAPTYWHGGVPGLHVGKALLPPAATGVRPTWELLRANHLRLQPARQDRVYLFSSERLAEVWAALYGFAGRLGWVYEVLPEGGLEPDTDEGFRPGASWLCPQARIVSARPLGLRGLAAVREAVQSEVRFRVGGAA